MISPDFIPGQEKGYKYFLDSTGYNTCKMDDIDPETGKVRVYRILPKTLKEKQVMTDMCTENINTFIEYAKADGNFLNAKGVSDGYHTFQELYDMRLSLTVALFHQIYERFFMELGRTWRSKQHSDGTMFKGMFIVGTTLQDGRQITFHYHNEHWDKFYFCEIEEKAPEWDGHTDKDVIERLLAL